MLSNDSYCNCFVFSDLIVQRNPEYNLALNCDIDHKNKLSVAEVELKYGDDHKNPNKTLFWSTSLNKKLLTLKNAMVTFKMNAKSPAHVSYFKLYTVDFILYIF